MYLKKYIYILINSNIGLTFSDYSQKSVMTKHGQVRFYIRTNTAHHFFSFSPRCDIFNFFFLSPGSQVLVTAATFIRRFMGSHQFWTNCDCVKNITDESFLETKPNQVTEFGATPVQVP